MQAAVFRQAEAAVPAVRNKIYPVKEASKSNSK